MLFTSIVWTGSRSLNRVIAGVVWLLGSTVTNRYHALAVYSHYHTASWRDCATRVHHDAP